MLKMSPSNDKKLLDSLAENIFKTPFLGDIGFVFYENDTPVGLAHIKSDNVKARILKVGILPKYQGQKLGDFFTRSLLLHFINAVEFIEIDYVSEYFKKFGFTEKDGKMIIESSTLVFPCECHKGV